MATAGETVVPASAVSQKRARRALEYRANDYLFSFDNAAFSDRILILERLPTEQEGLVQWQVEITGQQQVLNTTHLRTELFELQAAEEGGGVGEGNFCGGSGTEGQLGKEFTMQEEGGGQGCTDPPGEGSQPKKRSRQEENSEATVAPADCQRRGVGDNGAPPCCNSLARSICVSSVVLAANSGFFRRLLTNGMRESAPGAPLVLKVNSIEGELFHSLLFFLYSGRLPDIFPTDDQDRLVELLLLADKYEVPALVNMIVDMLEQRPMSLSACCMYLGRLPDIHHPSVQDLVKLSQSKLGMLITDLEEFTNQPAFLDMPELAMKVVVESENLPPSSEETLFRAVLKWVRHHHADNLERRKEAMEGLISNIRFPHIAAEVLHDSIVGIPEMSHKGAKALMAEALWYHAFSPARKSALVRATSEHRRYRLRRGVQVVQAAPSSVPQILRDVSIQDILSMKPGDSFQLQAVQFRGLLPVEGTNRLNVMPSLHRDNEELRVHVSVFADESVLQAMKGSKRETKLQCRFFVKQKSSHPYYARQVGTYDTVCYPDVMELELPRDFGGDLHWVRVSISNWSQFTRDNSYYFINGMLVLRMEVNIVS